MKKVLLAALLLGSLGVSVARAVLPRTYSQRTYTLFADGHYERRTCYNDGTCDPLEQGMFGVPRPGWIKHREEVWQNGGWVITVDQHY